MLPALPTSLQGYTIPLDKRLAADGRGLQQTVINDKFASLSESLFMAEAKAREAIQMRANIQRQLHEKEKVCDHRRVCACMAASPPAACTWHSKASSYERKGACLLSC